MTVKIVTDSSNTMERELAQELGITIVPLTIMVDGVVYSDLDLKEGQFLELMRASKALPKTSQPPVGLFAEVFSDLASDGSQIIAIHLSHALSGTVEASYQGAVLSGADVTVIDSGFTDQATKFQVIEAARMAQAGASKEDILAAIEGIRKKNRALYWRVHLGKSGQGWPNWPRDGSVEFPAQYPRYHDHERPSARTDG